MNIGRNGDSSYEAGLSRLSRRQYDQALVSFDQAIARKSHPDGALAAKGQGGDS